jgi:hypothetical protein
MNQLGRWVDFWPKHANSRVAQPTSTMGRPSGARLWRPALVKTWPKSAGPASSQNLDPVGTEVEAMAAGLAGVATALPAASS